MTSYSEAGPRSGYADLVKLQLQGRRFLEAEDERRLLEEGLTRYGLSLDQAAMHLRGAAQENDIALEGELAASARELLRTLADRHGRISREDFARAVNFYRARARRAISEAEARKRIKRLMEEIELRPKPAGRILRTRRWYRAIEA